LVGLVAMAFIAVACGSNDNTSAGPTGSTGSTGATGSTGTSPTVAQTAADCAQNATLTTSGTFTVGTDNPAYPPYFQGGTTKASDWKFNDPTNNKGFESAVAYAAADKLGFTSDQVKWVVVPFNQSYAPGAKSFDVDINEISYKPARAQAVDFSESYYDVNQALVAVKGTAITQATSIADLKAYTLASNLGSTSYDYIVNVIQPDNQPGVYQKLADAVAAINAGQIDGLVVDLPTALYMADPYVQQVKNSTVVGQFPNPAGSTPEYFGMVLAKDSSLTSCVNLALEEMKADGSLAALTTKWLSEKTNVGTVPEFGS
jgi:polar amino acid transport system substrate-binding protein